MARAFRVERTIGNNVLLTVDQQTETEYVIFGKGIGFSLKAGETIDSTDKRIEKRFRLDDTEQMKKYHFYLEEIDPSVIRITERIAAYIKLKTDVDVNPKLYLALPSHIQFAVYRLRQGMDIVNPFLDETKQSFPVEYEIAATLAEWISEQFHIAIPEAEIGFLAFHVYSGIHNVPVGQIVKQAEQQ
ncbi:PRD domain-containing protein [Paenibacillus alkaliterrae]|uniref:PRD domain-containing protein n=1 Tax=Paenibacillus alkaliterrae TaxID=320909 RepID=UPI001F377649|nr:PRD domain-containing protein [Paenibacillus alkaliterrae]MCF2938497.1 PRD domain-containing protein [Paenibacillus alkaliterrae]